MIPFVLALPWGLYAQTPIAGRPGRRALHDGETVEIDGRYGLGVALPAGAELRLSGRRWRAQAEAAPFPWIEGRLQLLALPTAALASERQVRLELHHGERAPRGCELHLHAHLLRPRGHAGDESAAVALLGFVQQVLGRILEADAPTDDEDEDDGSAAVTGWDRLLKAWPRREALAEEARREPIVEHAERLPALVAATAAHPRRVLKRTRQQMPIDRIQELDTACLEWLIRRPGLTVAEKAGPRQRLLGVAREEHLDTLENRVLKDFLRLSVEEASIWQRANARFGASERAQRVMRYLALCRACHRELCAVGISDPAPPVTPNFVLQQDARYRVIWRAYRELLSAEQREDDLWRWQRRLWADFARLAVVVGLHTLPGAHALARSPLHLRREQANGRWSDTLALLAVFLLELDGRVLVAEVHDVASPYAAPGHGRDDTPATAGTSGMAAWHCALGATVVVSLTDGHSGRRGSLCVWAIHGVALEQAPLAELAASADEALGAAIRQEALRSGERLAARGLVIRSKLDDVPEYATQSGGVYGLTLSPDPERIREAFGEFAVILQDSLERLFA